MDLIIATALLGFSSLASVVFFLARPKQFLDTGYPCGGYGVFYASEALGDMAGTAHKSSAIRESHLAKLGWEYEYGNFTGKYRELHSGVERVGPIGNCNEAS